MQLTTVDRVKTWSPVSTTQHDAMIRSLIAAVSGRIERHIHTHTLIQLRTEDYNAQELARRFHLKASPIYTTTAKYQRDGDGATIIVAAAPSIIYSPSREFTEDAEPVEDYHLRYSEGVVEFDFPVNYTGYHNPGSVRAAYYGGFAYTLDQLAASSLASAGTLAVAATVTGSLSGAKGVVLAHTANTSITVRVTSGVFQVGENFVDDANSANYATFTAWGSTGAPLCMAYPELVEACNAQVAWVFQNREHMGQNSISVEGATISMEKSGALLTGVKEMLAPFVRYGTSY